MRQTAGGMGPEATVELMRRVIEATAADDDCDLIRMIADSGPKLPPRIKAILEGSDADPSPVLTSMACGLEQSAADFLVIPCNTAHCCCKDIQIAVESLSGTSFNSPRRHWIVFPAPHTILACWRLLQSRKLDSTNRISSRKNQGLSTKNRNTSQR